MLAITKLPGERTCGSEGGQCVVLSRNYWGKDYGQGEANQNGVTLLPVKGVVGHKGRREMTSQSSGAEVMSQRGGAKGSLKKGMYYILLMPDTR